MAGRLKFSDEMINKIKTMLDGGSSYTEIAMCLGVSKNTVAGRIFRMGLESSRPKPKNFLLKNPPQYHPPWTPEREMQLRTLAAQGLSGTQIGREMGLSDSAIFQKAKRLMIKLTRYAPAKHKGRGERPVLYRERIHSGVQFTVAPGQNYYPADMGCQYRLGNVGNKHQAEKSDFGQEYERWADVPCCGEPRVDGRPYCNKHCLICYEPETLWRAIINER